MLTGLCGSAAQNEKPRPQHPNCAMPGRINIRGTTLILTAKACRFAWSFSQPLTRPQRITLLLRPALGARLWTGDSRMSNSQPQCHRLTPSAGSLWVPYGCLIPFTVFWAPRLQNRGLYKVVFSIIRILDRICQGCFIGNRFLTFPAENSQAETHRYRKSSQIFCFSSSRHKNPRHRGQAP